ncbi:MAG: HD domain-containing protein [Oscillospiraceae bacterium]
MTNKEQVMFKMIEFDKGDSKRIQHFMKVYEFAHLIAVGEDLDNDTKEILEVAAILHDIGIHPSEEKYGDCNGKHQEEQGPAYARALLKDLGCYSEEFIDRVCYLIGHHHTYNCVDGSDYQILIESDFLINSYEDNLYLSQNDTIEKMKKRIFKTKTGTWLLENMFEQKE